MTTLIHELLRRGCPVSAFTCDEALEGSDAPWMRFDGPDLRLYVVPRRQRGFGFRHGRPGRIVDLFRWERDGLRRALVHDQPALIHAHWSYEFGAAALASGIPTLLTCHDSPLAIFKSMPDAYRLGRSMMAWSVLRRSRHTTVVSPYLVDELKSWLPHPPAVVPNPIPDFVFDGSGPRRHWAAGARGPRIAMVLNGWSPRKNAGPGMEAMLRTLERHAGAELHLIGPGFGKTEAAWQWAAERNATASFHFHGAKSHLDTIDILRSADLLVHPAVEESFGLTIAEAMALGIPVVAGARSGAVPWVMGAQSGELVDVGSSQAIAAAIERLLSDASAYEAASLHGHRRALSHFSTAAVVDQYRAQYRAFHTLTTDALVGSTA